MAGSELDILIGRSALRRRLLLRFFTAPGLVRHASQLAREFGEPPQPVSRELRRLERAGILRSETIGRARRYRVDERSGIAESVRLLVHRTIGIEALLAQALTDVPGVEEAFLFGSYVRGDERPASDVDLLVVGKVPQRLLRGKLREVEDEIGRDINLVTYEHAELERLYRRSDSFVRDVLDGRKRHLIKRST